MCCERLLELANRGHHHDFHSQDTLAIMKETAPNAFYENSQPQLEHTVSHNAPTNSSYSQRSSVGIKSVQSDSNLNTHPNVYRSISRESFTALNISRRSTASSLSQTSLTSSDGEEESLLGTPTDSEMDVTLSDTMSKEERLLFVASAMAKYEYPNNIKEKVLDHQVNCNKAPYNNDNNNKCLKVSVTHL